MNCRQAYDFTMKYFDGELNDIESAQLKQHFKICKSCSEGFNELNGVLAYLESNSEIEPPEDFEVSVMDKVYSLEIMRNKRADMLLAILYGITGFLLVVMTTVVAFNLRGITLFSAFEIISESFSSFSSLMFTIYNILRLFYDMITGVAGTLLQVMVLLTRTYYYVFISLLLMLFIIQRMFVNIIRQGDRGVR